MVWQGKFYKIKYKNSYGYSYKDYITVKDSDVTTTETEYTATGTTTTSLNVRKSPSASATKLGTLGKNAKVDIVAKVSNGWYKIKYQDDYGYISHKYVKIDKDTDRVYQNPSQYFQIQDNISFEGQGNYILKKR